MPPKRLTKHVLAGASTGGAKILLLKIRAIDYDDDAARRRRKRKRRMAEEGGGRREEAGGRRQEGGGRRRRKRRDNDKAYHTYIYTVCYIYIHTHAYIYIHISTCQWVCIIYVCTHTPARVSIFQGFNTTKKCRPRGCFPLLLLLDSARHLAIATIYQTPTSQGPV